jgi:hypothetical protein
VELTDYTSVDVTCVMSLRPQTMPHDISPCISEANWRTSELLFLVCAPDESLPTSLRVFPDGICIGVIPLSIWSKVPSFVFGVFTFVRINMDGIPHYASRSTAYNMATIIEVSVTAYNHSE